MSWSEILGHEDNVQRFRRAAAAGRLASTYLLVGPPGIGKRTFALQLAKSLLCEKHSEAQLESCDSCSACVQVVAGTHPDVVVVSKPDDKSFIPLELLIGDEEHRMREGLCHDISLKAYRGGRKIAILDDADYLNTEGANCLLKTLEEPPPKAILILIGTSQQKQLPTIRSRCQIVRFQPLQPDQIEQLLVQQQIVEQPQEAQALSLLSHGSLERARQFADPDVRDGRKKLFDFLSAQEVNPFEFAKELNHFIEGAGKEGPPKRQRFKLLAQISADFYEQLMMRASGCDPSADLELKEFVERAERNGLADLDAVTASLERCVELPLQIEANANTATLMEAWLDDLTQLRPGQVR